MDEVEVELLEPCKRCVVPTRDPDTREQLPDLLRWLVRLHLTNFATIARARGPVLSAWAIRLSSWAEAQGVAPLGAPRRTNRATEGTPRASSRKSM